MRIPCLLWCCLAVLAATALQLQQPALWPAPVYAALTVAGMAGLLWRLRRASLPHGPGCAALCLAMAVLAFAQTGWRACAHRSAILPGALEGRSLRAEGEVIAMPQPLEQGVRLRFRIDRLHEIDGRPVAGVVLPQTVLLGWYGRGAAAFSHDALATDGVPTDAVPPLRAGEHWRLVLRLKAPHGQVNPHGFDYELWLWEQGLTATGYVRTTLHDAPPQRLASPSWPGIEGWRQAVREAVFGQIDARALAGVVAALSIGDQAAIERADWDVFRATGVAHLMAISGLHITGLAWLAALLAGALWRRGRWRGRALPLWWPAPHAARVVAVLAALGYALLTGWAVPAQRTVLMLALANALSIRGLRWPWPLSWSAVAAVLALCDPWALLQAGFWLSFVAVGLLFIGGGPVSARHPEPASWWRRGWRALRRLLHEQALLSVCLAPLSLLLFQQVSLVGFVANLVAVPWVTLVVTPLCLLGMLWPPLWSGAAWALGLLMPVLQTMAGWPWAQWWMPAVPAWVGAAALVGAACAALPWPLWWRLASLCWMLPLLGWQTPRPPEGRFELLAADIGQGHAVLLRTHGHALLYDTGPRYSRETDAGQRVLTPLLRALDVRLDRVLLSHADSDHSGGLRAVLAMQPQADVLTSLDATHPLLQGLHSGLCRQGQQWQWDGVHFELLHPPLDAVAGQGSPNAQSCVLRVTDAQGVSALLSGDIEAAQEQRLLSAGLALRADWLLVPHHGSGTSSTAGFVRAVGARWALVQAGYRNRFGHPRADVVARYEAEGATVVQTAACGAAHWRSDAPGQMHCERWANPRYWRHLPQP